MPSVCNTHYVLYSEIVELQQFLQDGESLQDWTYMKVHSLRLVLKKNNTSLGFITFC